MYVHVHINTQTLKFKLEILINTATNHNSGNNIILMDPVHNVTKIIYIHNI